MHASIGNSRFRPARLRAAGGRAAAAAATASNSASMSSASSRIASAASHQASLASISGGGSESRSRAAENRERKRSPDAVDRRHEGADRRFAAKSGAEPEAPDRRAIVDRSSNPRRAICREVAMPACSQGSQTSRKRRGAPDRDEVPLGWQFSEQPRCHGTSQPVGTLELAQRRHASGDCSSVLTLNSIGDVAAADDRSRR